MLEITAARAVFFEKVITDIGFFQRSHNIVDGLTMSMIQASLRQVLRTGLLILRPSQWSGHSDLQTSTEVS